MNKQALIDELKSLKIGFDQRAPHVIVNDDGIKVSAEEGDGAAEYFGIDGLTEDQYIDAELEAFAKRHGMYWEWESPGAIVLAR